MSTLLSPSRGADRMVPDVSAQSSPAAGCRRVRSWLSAFEAGHLAAAPGRVVRDHLLECPACRAVLASLLKNDVDARPAPWPAPVALPSFDVVTAQLRAGTPRFGTFWPVIQDALRNGDSTERAWGQARLDEIRHALDRLPPLSGAPRSARNAAARPIVAADLLGCDGRPTGRTVDFRLKSPPSFTPDGHFDVAMQTSAAGYDGRLVLCTLALSDNDAVSFGGPVDAPTQRGLRRVAIHESGVLASGKGVPLDRVRLAVVGS